MGSSRNPCSRSSGGPSPPSYSSKSTPLTVKRRRCPQVRAGAPAPSPAEPTCARSTITAPLPQLAIPDEYVQDRTDAPQNADDHPDDLLPHAHVRAAGEVYPHQDHRDGVKHD